MYKPAHLVKYDLPAGKEECHTLVLLQDADLEFASQFDTDSALATVYQAMMNRDMDTIACQKQQQNHSTVKTAVHTITRAVRNRTRFATLQAELIEDVIEYLDDKEERKRVRQELNREILYTMTLIQRIPVRGKTTTYNNLAALIKPVVPLVRRKKPTRTVRTRVPTQVYSVKPPRWDSTALQSLSIVL